MQLISKAEYARRRGVSGAAVTQAVKAGRLTLVDGKVNLDTADAEWGGKSRPRVNSKPAVAQEKKAPPRHEPDDVDLQIPPWQDSKAKQAYLDAEKAADDLLKSRAKLLDAAAVRAEWAKQTASVRESLLTMPARLAPVLAPESDPAKVQNLIDIELRAALSAFVVE